MSENENRWEVDDFDESRMEQDALGIWRWLYSYANDTNLSGKLIAIRDLEFVIELVKEIERLQAENIRLFDITKRISDNAITNFLLTVDNPYDYLTTVD